MTDFITRFAAIVSELLLALLCLSPAAASAQDEPPPPPRWSFESEVGASVFFGASDQTTVAAELGVDRRSTHFEVENAFSYLYGEGSDGEGNSFVNKRSWSVGSNLDYKGFSRVNPYVFANALSSLEKRIDLRAKGGAGAKFTVLDSDVSSLDFALAVLVEKTFEDSEDNGDDELLGRWTGEMNYRRVFSEERVVFQAAADYNPVFDEFANYTIQVETSLAFRLSEIISLKLSVVDNYDSRAEKRGAGSNNDGRMLFSVLAAF